MKIYYKSKLAKILTFLDGFTTMMFFGVVITERKKLSGRTISHEGTHIKQYWDIVQLGFVISVIIFLPCFLYDVTSWWMLSLIIIPFILYYIIYGVEYLYWRCKGYKSYDAYLRVGFERQANYIEETWWEPDNLSNNYEIFGWWKKLK